MVRAKRITHEFLQAYRKWLLKGAPKSKCFDRSRGLCSQIENYIDVYHGGDRDLRYDVQQVLTDMFDGDDLGVLYPFGGYRRFVEDGDKETMHLNEMRVQWVMKHTLPNRGERVIVFFSKLLRRYPK